MFDEERQEWDAFFNFYKKKFGEEVGLVPGIFSDDDFEIDLVIGEQSEDLRGLRILQLLEVENDETEKESTEEKQNSSEPIKNEDKDLETDEEEEETNIVEVMLYDFIAQSGKVTFKGVPIMEINFDGENSDELEEETHNDKSVEVETPSEEEDEGEPTRFKLQVYAENDEFGSPLTGVLFTNLDDPTQQIYFLEDPAFD